MKKTYLLYAIVVVCCGFAFSSCNKVAATLANATGISWDGIDTTVTITPQSDTNAQLTMGTGAFSYNLDSLIKSQTNKLLGLSNIDTVEITSCVLTIQNPDASDNFANFQSAQLYFSTNYNPSGVNMGEIDNNPNAYAETLTIPVNNTNLKGYVSPLGTTSFSYTLSGKLRKATTTTLTVKVHIGYYIHVKP